MGLVMLGSKSDQAIEDMVMVSETEYLFHLAGIYLPWLTDVFFLFIFSLYFISYLW